MNFRTRRPHGRLSLPVLPLLALAGLALAPSAQDPAPEGSGDPLVTVPEDVPPGADQPIASMIQAAGGMDVWMASPGLRWQVLETFRAMRNRNTRNWHVYSRVPMLQRFDPAGNGFVLSEFADLQQQGPDYRRDVYTEGAAWAEQGGSYNRLPASLTRSEAMVRREYFLGAMPFSLQVLGAELEYRSTESTRNRSLHKFFLRLPMAVRMHKIEQVQEFFLFVDAETWRPTQLKWAFVAEDRSNQRDPYTWAHVDFQGERTLAVDMQDGSTEELRLYARRNLWLEDPVFILSWDLEDPRSEAMPPEAMRRPWFSGSIWGVPERADFWDPPPAQGPEPASSAGG